MLIGQHQSKISAKGRLAFPKKFRDEMGDKLVITVGYEGALMVVSTTEWQNVTAISQNISFIHSPARDTTRFLLGQATQVELDDQGRFILPLYLREQSGIVEEVVFLGLCKYVEIWDNKRWEKYQQELNSNSSIIAEKLSQLNDQH